MAGDVSFDPDDAQEGGGGLVQSVSGAVLTFECVLYDYNGAIPVPVPSIHVHGEFEGEDGEAGTFEEYYSAGDASKLRPKKDGTGFQALIEGAGMTKSCKAMQLIASIVSANGGDKSLITANIKDLDGLNVDMERKPDIDRPGLGATNKAGRTRTIFLVTAVNSLPGEAKPKSKSKGAAKAAPASKGKGKVDAVRIKTIEAINAAIEANGGEVSAEDLPQLLFRRNKKDPDVKAMTELAADGDFLKDEETPWGFDGETLTAAA